MTYLFSEEGLRAFEAFCNSKMLFAFDFDGTLTEIVRDAEKAHMSEKTESLLNLLREKAPVAIISGRGLGDLRAKFSSEPNYLVGNHGLEGILTDVRQYEVFRRSCEKWQEQLSRILGDKLRNVSGLQLEDKTYSIALHYRKTRDKKQARGMILESLSKLDPSPRIILGKCVVNLVPSGAPHKGVALMELMLKSKTQKALYAGDDDTDEDVFTLPNVDIFKVRIGFKKTSHAQYYLKEQKEINQLLKLSLDQLKDAPSKDSRNETLRML